SALGQGLAAGDAYSIASSVSELLVGGNFQKAGGTPSVRLALWHVPHVLSLRRSGSSLALSWPSTGTNFLLEAVDTLWQTNWAAVPEPWSIVDNQCVVTNTIPTGSRFYRLRRK